MCRLNGRNFVMYKNYVIDPEPHHVALAKLFI